MYRLTKEGEKYSKIGVPERRLVNLLKEKGGKIDVKEASKVVEELGIAIKWCLENGWIEKKGSTLKLLKVPDKTDVEKAIERLSEGKTVEKDLIKKLAERGLVERVGKKVEVVSVLTKDIIKNRQWVGAKFKKYDVSIVGKKIFPGKRHPYVSFLNEMRRKLLKLGFKEVRGRTIVTEFWNFDALFQPQDHPSRDWTQTYSLKKPKYGKLPNKKLVERVKEAHENGWKTGSTGWGYKWDPKKASKLMPVAHDTAISPMVLSSDKLEVPGKYFQIVRCYRPDVIDATHGVEFNQMGGFVVGKELDFRDLLGLLEDFVHELVGPYRLRFLTAYFPFTEPSCEVAVKHPKLGWMEVAGAGVFRPELTEPLGVRYPVIAWGFGIDRLAMFRLGLNDIRELFTRNLKWLREKEVVVCQR